MAIKKVEKAPRKDAIWEWTPKNNVLEGEYRGFMYGVGRFNNLVFHIKDIKTDKVQTIWANYGIRTALLSLKEGSYVKIVYKGLKTMPGSKGKDGKPKKQFDFDITTKKNVQKKGQRGNK